MVTTSLYLFQRGHFLEETDGDALVKLLLRILELAENNSLNQERKIRKFIGNKEVFRSQISTYKISLKCNQKKIDNV